MENNRFSSIDSLKSLMALFVIMNHCFFIFRDKLINIIDIGVPVFLMISGFFLYSGELNKECLKVKKYIKSIFFLYIESTLIYFLWRVFLSLISNATINSYTLYNLIDCLHPFGGHLWYLHAYLYALIIVYTVLYLLRIKLSAINIYHIIIILSISIVLAHINSKNIFVMPLLQRAIGICLTFFLIGYFLKKHISFIHKSIGYSFSVIGLILCFLDDIYGFDKTYTGYNIGTYFLAIGLFIIAIKTRQRECLSSKIGFKYATYIYILHWIPIDILNFISMKNNLFSNVYFYIAPFIIYFATLFFSYIYIKLKYIIKHETKTMYCSTMLQRRGNSSINK